MPSTPPASRVLNAAVTGLASTAYYATPDLIRSRAARGWAKAALTGVVLAASVSDLRRGLEESRARRAAAAQDPEEEQVDWGELWGSMTPRRRASVCAAGAAALAVSVGSVVAIERAVFRRGERRRAAGVRFAHTRPAVVWGVLGTALSLLPDDTGTPPRPLPRA
jgi:hypothetical protein